VVGVIKRVGHERAKAGDLGEFWVNNANHGSWYLWTADGLLAARIFQDLRTGARRWRMERHERGMRQRRAPVRKS
jgi:hypothetical protein